MQHFSGPIIYIKHNREKGEYYVGQTREIVSRYGGRRNVLGSFSASLVEDVRKYTESEMIQFCKAFGLPLRNIMQTREPVTGYELPKGQY